MGVSLFLQFPPRCLCGNASFARPLFSYSSELLSPQTLYFDNHPHCPGVEGTSSLESEKTGLAAGNFAVEIFVSARSSDAAAGGAVDHADLHEVRLRGFLRGVLFFASGGGQPAAPPRAPPPHVAHG